jgi:DNA-binding protein H-NS
MALRKRVDEMLHRRRAELEKQLNRIAGPQSALRSPLRGRKVPPKYRGPSGETWASRGARRNIEVRQVKLGQAVAQDLVGLLLRSNVARDLMACTRFG